VHHEISLISTIAVGLVYALIGGYFASRLRLPPLVGYLLAGVALGPFTPGFVADAKLAPQLAEIGVILLMFGVGMHFSIRDLLAVRNVAVPGALAQIASAVALTYGVASFWGWSLGPSLVLGLALSVASTVVLLRALEEQGVLKSVSGQIAIGWLIVEDLVTVIILVLLPVLASALGGVGSDSAGQDNGGGQLLLTLGIVLGKFVGFVLFMLLVGARLLPWLLERVVATNSRELFTLAVVAAAIGIGFEAAELFGLSFALGAFFAGVVVGESDHSHQAAVELQPLQDAFTALFFVAMGMLFDPSYCRAATAPFAGGGCGYCFGQVCRGVSDRSGVPIPARNDSDRRRQPGSNRGVLLYSRRTRHRTSLTSSRGPEPGRRRRSAFDHTELLSTSRGLGNSTTTRRKTFLGGATLNQWNRFTAFCDSTLNLRSF